MKLEKAIEILEEQAQNPDLFHFPDLKDSINLSIEALKRIKYMRNFKITNPEKPLPGETKE